jgi:hypothetical membrane protein
MTSIRKTAYTISARAIVWFFLIPQPYAALTGALLLLILAYTIIAEKSVADGIVLSGISLLLIGILPGDHPPSREPFFESVRFWIIVSTRSCF